MFLFEHVRFQLLRQTNSFPWRYPERHDRLLRCTIQIRITESAMRYATLIDTLRIPVAERAVNRHRLSTVIDDAERAGRLTLTTAQIAELLPGVSPNPLRPALLRQQRRGRPPRVARAAGQWLLVPLMHSV